MTSNCLHKRAIEGRSKHVVRTVSESRAPTHRASVRKRPTVRSVPSTSCSSVAGVTTQVTESTTEAAELRPPGDNASIQLHVQVITSMEQVSQQDWDSLVTAQEEVNPFLKWTFLHILEASGSAAPEEGWGPQHLIIRNNESGELLGACPLYLKGHSYGEYVFDSSWANYSHMVGKRYYPKLQCCVPFTPVTGNRLLLAPGPLQPVAMKALVQTLMTLTDELQVSSLHVTFPTGAEWATLGALGFQQRRGIQYHWENRGYNTFEDFLSDLNQRKRKNIRQERKAIAKQGLTVKRLLGSEVSAELWETFYQFYLTTVDKKWGSAYLQRDFFHMLGSEMGDEVLLVVAEEGGEVVAAALNLIGSHCIYGRNWGCRPDKEYKYLHFELCYYQAIEEAIARGLPRVEAGAQGEHKLQRGYLPNFTYSCHYIPDPAMQGAVSKFLQREDHQLLYTWQALTLQGSPFQKDATVDYLVDKIRYNSSLSSLSSLSSTDESDMSAAVASVPLPEEEQSADDVGKVDQSSG